MQLLKQRAAAAGHAAYYYSISNLSSALQVGRRRSYSSSCRPLVGQLSYVIGVVTAPSSQCCDWLHGHHLTD